MEDLIISYQGHLGAVTVGNQLFVHGEPVPVPSKSLRAELLATKEFVVYSEPTAEPAPAPTAVPPATPAARPVPALAPSAAVSLKPLTNTGGI